MKNSRQAYWTLIVLGFCYLIAPRWAMAFSFTMSESEFSTWPVYCQARFVTTDAGKTHAFIANFPVAVVSQVRDQLGPNTWERVHHWCSGMIWLNRARVEMDPKVREFKLNSAAHEAQFTLNGLLPDSPIIPLIYVTFGQVCQERKDFKCAIDNFEKAIAGNAGDSTPYSALALLYSRKKQFDLAREALMRGDKALDGKSPEIHYNLGLILLDMGDVDGAVSYAQKAYLAGYSLPGLRKKLTQMGRWVELIPNDKKPPQATQSTTP